MIARSIFRCTSLTHTARLMVEFFRVLLFAPPNLDRSLAPRTARSHPERVGPMPHSMVMCFGWPVRPNMIARRITLLIVARDAGERTRIPASHGGIAPKPFEVKFWELRQGQRLQLVLRCLGDVMRPEHQHLSTFRLTQSFSGINRLHEFCILPSPAPFEVAQSDFASQAQVSVRTCIRLL